MKIPDFFDFSLLNNVTSKLILTCQLYELAKDQAMFLALQVRIEFLVGTPFFTETYSDGKFFTKILLII